MNRVLTWTSVFLLAFAVLAPAQEDDLRKVSADFQKAGQVDDRIDAKEMNEFVDRCLAIAEKKSGKVGMDAVVWVFYVANIGEAEAADKAKGRTKAIDILCERYADSSRVFDALNYLQVRSETDAVEFSGYFDRLTAKSKNKDVKTFCEYRKLDLLMQKDAQAPLGIEERKAVIAKLEDLIDRAGDLPMPGDKQKRTYEKVIEPALFKFSNLYVGATAPEIEAADIDGVNFKLSDYRGKVVMLDFWGDW